MQGKIPKPKDRINYDIRESEVRLVDENGQHVGVINTQEAIRRAEAAGLDLVEVSSASRPYVCRIMDYGNYKYEQAKKQKDARRKQHVIDVKEVKLRPRIDEHDYEVKMRNARKFILQNDKVKFVVMFRGRERNHSEFGTKLLSRVIEELQRIVLIGPSAGCLPDPLFARGVSVVGGSWITDRAGFVDALRRGESWSAFAYKFALAAADWPGVPENG